MFKPSKLKVILLAIPEVILCMLVGAVGGFISGLDSVRDAWEDSK